jgi:hypothetical protein
MKVLSSLSAFISFSLLYFFFFFCSLLRLYIFLGHRPCDNGNVSFWSYELCKRVMTMKEESSQPTGTRILLCGGIAGIVTWASVFPLDVIKTRLQAQNSSDTLTLGISPDRQTLLQPSPRHPRLLSAIEITKEAYGLEGIRVFYRGLGICSLRAFIVNAVQVCHDPKSELKGSYLYY